jgi:sodium-dependent phosphate transporter
MTIGINTTYWIIKGTKGQSDRFGTSRLVRLAKEGNLWPTIQIGLQVGALCSFVSLLFIPYINKRIEDTREDTREEETHDKESYIGNKTGIGYIQKQLTKDVHSNMSDETRVIHQNMIRHDPKAERFFTYIQVFTAIVDSFSHGANDVANAMGPFSAAYIAYKKGKVVKSHEMKDTTMFWILGMGGAGMILGLTTYGYKIMNAMGVKLVSITPSRGACIELGAAFVIIYGTGQGWPLSTTHCQIGATVAVGLFEGVKGVNCKLLAKTCLGWILTLVIVGCTTAILVGPSPEPLKDEYCYGFYTFEHLKRRLLLKFNLD